MQVINRNDSQDSPTMRSTNSITNSDLECFTKYLAKFSYICIYLMSTFNIQQQSLCYPASTRMKENPLEEKNCIIGSY